MFELGISFQKAIKKIRNLSREAVPAITASTMEEKTCF
jgi:hypothetical protein